MFEARGTPKDGREVKGWYFPANARSYIIRDEKALGPICWKPEFIEDLGFYIVEVEKSSISFATGKKDANGKMIYGNVHDEGFMGGDRIELSGYESAAVYWDTTDGCWSFYPDDSTDGVFDLYLGDSSDLEIIEKE